MKIGVFDSGLGGLIVLKAIRKQLPQYDYVYLGDTKRVPYGNRDRATVYDYAVECIDYLFKHGCTLIVVACNTVSVEALRRLQCEYLPKHYPGRRILGVVVPTIEAVVTSQAQRIGIIGTRVTIESGVYTKELNKAISRLLRGTSVMPGSDPASRILELDSGSRMHSSGMTHQSKVFQQATPLLVPFVEENETKLVTPVLKEYLQPLIKKHIDSLVLGCTHYCLLKSQIKKLVGPNVKVFAQDDIIPGKLSVYLKKHAGIAKKLSRNATCRLLVTEKTSVYTTLAKQWFGTITTLKQIDI